MAQPLTPHIRKLTASYNFRSRVSGVSSGLRGTLKDMLILT